MADLTPLNAQMIKTPESRQLASPDENSPSNMRLMDPKLTNKFNLGEGHKPS